MCKIDDDLIQELRAFQVRVKEYFIQSSETAFRSGREEEILDLVQDLTVALEGRRMSIAVPAVLLQAAAVLDQVVRDMEARAKARMN